jgi:hypothetical protein
MFIVVAPLGGTHPKRLGATMRNHTGHDTNSHGTHGHAGPGGLAVSEHGYTLDFDSTILPTGRQTVTFRVNGPDGRPVTGYAAEHEKELHLIAVRRDTSGFQHVHPVMDEKGTWSTEVSLEPGDWRFFADIHPVGLGRTLTLGIDVAVAGQYSPRPLPETARTARTGEYTVTLDGELVAGQDRALTLTIERDGRPVTDLQPYLAAYGHLVALRAGDLGYLHVHPEGVPGDGVTAPGPGITFVAAAPSEGVYRLFLDFRHGDTVRTAEFTLRTTRTAPGPDAAPWTAHRAAHGDHHGAHAHH